MAKQQFNKLIWLVDTIYRNGRITFAEINRRWRAGDRLVRIFLCVLFIITGRLSKRCSTLI